MSQAGAERSRKGTLGRLVPLFLAVALVLVLVAQHYLLPAPESEFRDRRELMDTWVTVIVYSRSPAQAKRAIDAAFARMAQVERAASIFSPQAEAYRLNQAGRLDDPSDDLWDIIQASIRFYRLTGGVFDIAVEPLIELWKSEIEGKHFWELDPDTQKAKLAEVRKLLGADRIELISSPRREIVLPPGMKITLGGIAKGYAVDQGLAALREAGIHHALIDAGGDLGAFGGKPDGDKWKIALRNPKDASQAILTFSISDGAIATSGNYERYFDPQARVGHIIDPRTGYSARLCSSATVIAPTCTEADALATAVFVLGPKDGLDLVNSLDGVEALILGYDDPRTLYKSSGLDRYVEQGKAKR